MPQCKYCEQPIEWRQTMNGWKPVQLETLKYEECVQGDILITLTGLIYKVVIEQTFPNVKGQLLHDCIGDALLEVPMDSIDTDEEA